MELKCVKPYSTLGFSLAVGDTTEELNISEAKKKQMITDFPESFEAIETAAPAPTKAETKVPMVETKENTEPAKKRASKAAK